MKITKNNSILVDYIKIKAELLKFRNKNDQLKIINRKHTIDFKPLFQKLYDSFFSISGFVSYISSKEDIQNLFANQINSNIKNDFLYDLWLDDMSNLCKVFCKFMGEEKISFWVGTKRGCKRYHVDMVPFRLLVTYDGDGTELLPNHAANRKAFTEGKSNKEIVKDNSALQIISNWDIAIFRGGKKGILHRTPDSALNNVSSILMRLDNKGFLESIKKVNEVA